MKSKKQRKPRTVVAKTVGAGSTSLAGYEYQIDVSIWLALDLVMANKFAQEVTLEPVSQEDLEADLEEFEPGRATTVVSTGGYRLVVQAKLRTTDIWGVSGIKNLLEHGSEERDSAAARLKDPKVRYLLITNAALNKGVRGLGVRRAGVWPENPTLPEALGSLAPSGRVAVICNQDEERLATDIKRLLTDNFRVPNARWKECLQALRQEARRRICSVGERRWNQTELEQAIRAHDGYIASSPELDRFVHPTNWDELTTAMNARYAALIVGQSGTGKTLASKKLIEELRERIPGLTRVPITQDPQQLTSDETEPPVIYDIEDPWGRYDFNPNSRPWNAQLATLLRHARHDRMIVATSRRDVAQSSGALESVKRWIVNLEAEHYGPAERRRLYHVGIDDLPRSLQAVAAAAEEIVLRELATPLEIQKFFDALPVSGGSENRNDRKLVADAIRKAHHEAIERTVINQIEAQSEVRAAAVIWGLLKTDTRLSLRSLRSVEEQLADCDDKFESGVASLVGFFVAARNLRQSDHHVSYYHPRVESGIEQALESPKNRLVARKALGTLVDVLTSVEDTNQQWNSGSAARLLAAAESRNNFGLTVSKKAQAAVDDWLVKFIPEDRHEFEAHLRLAASAGSVSSVVAELARYLLQEPGKRNFGIAFWDAPARDESWCDRMRNDPATSRLLETFIRKVLPWTSTSYPATFAAELQRLGPPMTPAFLAAARQVVSHGYISADEAIAEGALDNIQDFELIVDVAVSELTPSAGEQERREVERLAYINQEYSDEYSEMMAQDDDSYTARKFLEAYTSRARRQFGWQAIVRHRHSTYLLGPWLDIISAQPTEVAPDFAEIEGAIRAATGGPNEVQAWALLQQHWVPHLESELAQCISAAHSAVDARRSALVCLATHAPERLATLVGSFIADQLPESAAGVAVDLGEIYVQHSKNDLKRPAVQSAMEALPAPLNAIAVAAVYVRGENAPNLPDDAIEYLSTCRGGSAELRRFRVIVDGHLSLPVEDDIRWLLENTDDDEVAVEAVEAAARHDMGGEVASALNHRFARAGASALVTIAKSMATPLPKRLLDMADAKGSPIRKALVQVLAAALHPAHLPAMLKLAADSWASSWHMAKRFTCRSHVPQSTLFRVLSSWPTMPRSNSGRSPSRLATPNSVGKCLAFLPTKLTTNFATS